MSSSGGRAGYSAGPTRGAYGTMRIRSFPTPISEEIVVNTWTHLRQAIVEIQSKNTRGLSFEELYRSAYNLVLQKHGDRLYSGTEAVINEHMNRIRDSILNNLNNMFLTHVNSCWKDHQTSMIMIRDILMYMDRVYVPQRGVPGVYKLGMTAFCNLVLRHPTVRENLRKTLLEMVRAERSGQVVSRSLIKDTCQMFVHLGVGSLEVYVEDFEQPFLEQSREFYRVESQAFLDGSNPTASDYVQKVKHHIDSELKWARDYLDPSTEPKILAVLDQELIERHMPTIVAMPGSGLNYMLSNDRFDELASLYRVLSRVEEGPKLINKFISSYLREQGQAIVNTTTPSPQQYFNDLLHLRDRSSQLLSSALNNQALYRNQINSDFEYFVNLNQHSPEYLSLYIDEKLRKGMKGLPDQEIEAIFDKCIVMFRYIQDKDIFENYYKKHLMKRLLLSKSQSDDQEKMLISKLMAECGAVYTSKLEGMFKDMAVSKSLMDEFSVLQTTSSSASGHRPRSFDLNVRVLTTGLWPSQSSASIGSGANLLSASSTPSGVASAIGVSGAECLPEELASSFEAYHSFYLNKHNGRKISLQLQMGYAEVSALFFASDVNSTASVPPSTPPVILPTTTSSMSSASTSSRPTASELPGSPGLPLLASEASSAAAGSGLSARKYFLQVSTYQMLVLLKFNQRPRYTYAELAAETSIPERELKRALLSLALGRLTQRILCKEPSNTREISPTDVFYVNDAFVSKHIKVRVQTIAMKENEPERLETRDRVDENRRYVIEATVVRVMKSRKVLGHTQLILEVTEMLKSHFQPTPLMIKQRIESLIEREFLARMEDDRRVYKYLA